VPVWDSTIGLELAQLTHTAIVELFEIDVSALGGGVHFLHHGSNELLGNVVWQGVTYYRYPVQFRGVERAGDGPMPRPKLTLGNVGGLLGALIREFRGLERAQVTRRRTLAKYLDAANFVGGLNENADPTSHYPDEVWHVDRVAARDDVAVELDLASRLDVQGAMLPARQVLHGTCSWRYRGPECGYTGPPVAKADDTPTLEWSLDGCSHTLRGCRLRVWPDGQLPFGGFPGVGVIRNA
jgi:lambda family phage minor tail protein L